MTLTCTDKHKFNKNIKKSIIHKKNEVLMKRTIRVSGITFSKDPLENYNTSYIQNFIATSSSPPSFCSLLTSSPFSSLITEFAIEIQLLSLSLNWNSRLFQWFPSSNQSKNLTRFQVFDGLNHLSWYMEISEWEGRKNEKVFSLGY